MDIGLEPFLITLLFVLPGFLSSRLIDARTPAAASPPSSFHETAESLLRSAIVHLIIVLTLFPIIYIVLQLMAPTVISQLRAEGFTKFFSSRPDIVPFVTASWALTAFVMAAFFGYKWDPIDVLLKRLNRSQGTTTDDLISLLASALGRARARNQRSQLWIQVRTTSGHTYQGEFVFGSYRVKDLNRELLITGVTHFSPPPRDGLPPTKETVDYALLDLSKCDPVEARIIIPTE